MLVKDAKDLVPPGPLTVMAWIKPVGKRKTMEIVCHKGDVQKTGFRLRNFWSRLSFDMGTGEEQVRLRAPEWSIEHGFWQHVAATYDGRFMKIFLNGKEIARSEGPAAIAPCNVPLRIGAYVDPKHYVYKGLLDELILFDTARTEDEIFEDMARCLHQP